MSGWEVLNLIISLIWGAILGYTIAVVWRIDRRTRNMDRLQSLMAMKEVMEIELECVEKKLTKKKPAKKTATKKTTKKGTK